MPTGPISGDNIKSVLTGTEVVPIVDPGEPLAANQNKVTLWNYVWDFILTKLAAATGVGISVAADAVYALRVGVTGSGTAGRRGIKAGSGMVMGDSGADFGMVGYNARFTSTNGSYLFDHDGWASRVEFDTGSVDFQGSSASGTAGNAITWTSLLEIANVGSGGYVSVKDTTDATSPTTGAFRCAGGGSVQKMWHVGLGIQAPNGSAASPSIQIGASDRGISAPSGTSIALSIGGSALFSTSAGGASINRNAANTLGMTRAQDGGGGGDLAFFKSRGSLGSEAAVNQTDQIGTINFYAYGASQYVQCAQLVTSVIETSPSNTQMGVRVSYASCPVGSATLTSIVAWDHTNGMLMFGLNAVINALRHHMLRVYTIATKPVSGSNGETISLSDGASGKPIATWMGGAWKYADGVSV